MFPHCNSSLLFICVVLNTQLLKAQDCSNCQQPSIIVMTPFSIKGAPQTTAAHQNLLLLNTWLGNALTSKLGKCAFIMAMDGSYYAGNGVNIASLEGIEIPSLIEDDIAPLTDEERQIELPGDAGYMITGSYNLANETIQLEVKTACNFKPIMTVTQQMKMDAEPGIEALASQLANTLASLPEKIRSFEKQERLKEPSRTINTKPIHTILVTPAKKSLKPGESTEVTFQLTDCDGTPVAGRTLSFTDTRFKDIFYKGSKGGGISPAKVITDQQGNAKATFTLNAQAKEAYIRVFSHGNDVRGCEQFYRGLQAINVIQVFTGSVTYNSYSLQPACTVTEKGESSTSTNVGTATGLISYSGAFSTSAAIENNLITLAYGEEDEDGTSIPGFMDEGSYFNTLTSNYQHVVTCDCAGKGDVTIVQHKSTMKGRLKSGLVQLNIDEHGDIERVKLNLVYTTTFKNTRHATSMPPYVEKGEEAFNITADLDKNEFPNMLIKKEEGKQQTIYTIHLTSEIPGECPFTRDEKLVVTIKK